MHPQQGQDPQQSSQPYQQGQPGVSAGYSPAMPADPGMAMAAPTAVQYGGIPTMTGPAPKSYAVLYVVAILLVAGLFGVVVGFGAAAAFDDSVDTVQKKRLRERTTSTGKIGQKMIDQRMEFTVNSVSCGISEIAQGGGRALEPEGQFCAAEVTMKNRTDEQTYMSLEVAAITSSREKVQFESLATSYYNDPEEGTYWTADFRANETVTRSFVFVIPEGEKIVTLELNDQSYEKEDSVTVKVD